MAAASSRVRRRGGVLTLLALLGAFATCGCSPTPAGKTPPRAHTSSASSSSSSSSPPPPLPRSRQPAGTAGQSGSDIVFPDSQFRPRYNGPRPNCAREGNTFCEAGVEGYPMGHLNQVLDNQISFHEYFGNDSIGQNLVDRFGPDGETTMCQSREQLIFPKMGQNLENQWVYIVNLDSSRFQQGIRVELCQNADQPCTFASNFPNGVNAVCRQKYIFRRLLSVADGGDTVPDNFRMPSCCACFINSEVTSRFLLQSNGRSSK